MDKVEAESAEKTWKEEFYLATPVFLSASSACSAVQRSFPKA